VYQIKRKADSANVSLNIQTTSSERKTRVTRHLLTTRQVEWCLRYTHQ